MKHILFTLVASILSITAYGQTEVDLYRFSNTFNEGSSRFEAMGGSFGALGADIGCARINPAGFGRYSTSQFSFGLAQVSVMNKSDFRGTSTESQKNRMRLSNLGFVFTSDLSSERQGWLYQQIGFGYTGVANFSNTVQYNGQQFESLLDGFASQAQGVAPADLSVYYPFSSSLAYETYAIDDDGANNYTPRLTSGDMLHSRTISTTGGINEMHISYSANYLNKLYLGVNVGFQFLRYTENIVHSEQLIDTAGVSLRSFDYFYNLKTAGNGTNLKIGAIYLPSDAFRIGLAIHTPTAFELTDDWSADMIAHHDTGDQTVPAQLKPSGNYKYRMRTPARMIGSVAYVFGTKASVNIDVEYLDYRWAHFKTTTDDNYESYDYKLENAAADDRFTNVINVRVGAEYVINSVFFLRGGFGYLPKGDKALYDYGGKVDYLYSGGIGIRAGMWTIDAALKMLTQTKTYTAFDNSFANINTNQRYIVVSAQYKFN